VASAPGAPAQDDPAAEVAAAVSDAAVIATRLIGAPYVWGGATPRGFDCSGLTKYVYAQFGLNLPHKASQQFSTRYGRSVGTVGALVAGDLVFFVRTTSARGITHVGIYTGGGMMVTANTPGTGVQHVSIYGQYWRSRFAGAIRPTR
jgi:cell wall-associated NlpC family hydrolase